MYCLEFHNIYIVFRHLAAYEVGSVIVGASYNLTVENIVCGENEVLDLDRDISALTVRKERLLAGKREAIRTYVVHCTVV